MLSGVFPRQPKGSVQPQPNSPICESLAPMMDIPPLKPRLEKMLKWYVILVAVSGILTMVTFIVAVIVHP